MGSPLLLVEDTPSLSLVYKAVLEKAGYSVECVLSCAETRAKLRESSFNVILLDLLLPDGDGAELMAEILKDTPNTKIIVITANGSINRAVAAMRAGAFDFLVKPFDETRLLSAVRNAVAETKSSGPVEAVPVEQGQFHGFFGSSQPMQSIYDMVNSIGRSSATVFITGESGTGKEVCAQAIHAVSSRAGKAFLPLNCGAIPRDLLESEVFGHLKGSFTGAIADKKGAAEEADGGTLFLDEICEMDLALQTKLLRFLQTSMIQPVGATAPRFVDVRIVCATNRDPMEEVRAGRFREDLFYRLHVVPIHLPPLVDRGNDVNEIADRFLKIYAKEEGKNFAALSPEVQKIFRDFSWPGNVRQLLNALRNIVVLNDAEVVTPEMLPFEIQRQIAMEMPRGAPVTPIAPTDIPSTEPEHHVSIKHLVGRPLAEVERELIEATIEFCDGSIPKAAHYLDVSASTIYRKREQWAARDKKSLPE